MKAIFQKLQSDQATLFKWTLSVLVPFCIFLVPCTEYFTHDIKWFLMVTALGILIVAFELTELMAVSMLFPVGYLVTGIVPMDVIYSAWTTTTIPIVVIGGYLLANTLERIGLLKRIALWCVLRVGGSYYGLLYGIFIAGCILTVATGGNSWIIMAAFSYGICKAFNLGKSIDSAIIMLVGGFGSTCSMVFFYIPYFTGIIYSAARTVDSTITVSWLGYLFNMLPYLVYSIVLIWILPQIFKPKVKLPGKEYFMREYQNLGKMSSDEKKAGIAVIGLLLFMLTSEWHGINLDWAFIIIPWFLYLPGFHVATREDIQKIDFGMVFFCVACLSIGLASAYVGVGKMLAEILVPILKPMGATVILAAVFVVGVLLNLLLTPLAVVAGFSEPIVQIAQGLNMSPLAPLYSLYVSMDQVFFPYEYLQYLIFYAFGLIYMKDFIKMMTFKSVLAFLFFVFLMVPWWKVIGLY